MSSGTKGITFTWQLIGAMALGTVAGLLFGNRAAFVGEFGKLIIQLVKTFATPLLFFSILEAVISTRVEGKHARRMLSVAFINAVIALTIGLTLSNIFRVGDRLAPLFASAAGTTAAPVVAPKIEFGRFLSTFVPTSVVQPFVENIAITVILLALLLGFAIRSLKDDPAIAPLAANAHGLVKVGLRVTEAHQ
jgi:Na+/H+-dicarboxylate symporter